MTIIHVGKGDSGLYTLVQDSSFKWFLNGKPTEVESLTLPLALIEAQKAFKLDRFQLLQCGVKFSLPERDEHGTPALYCDMIKSLASSNGQYFDPLYGQNFIVHQIPSATRELIRLFTQ